MFSQNHLVEAWYEVGIKESTMEDGQTKNSADELEVTQVVRVDTRVRIYL